MVNSSTYLYIKNYLRKKKTVKSHAHNYISGAILNSFICCVLVVVNLFEQNEIEKRTCMSKELLTCINRLCIQKRSAYSICTPLSQASNRLFLALFLGK